MDPAEREKRMTRAAELMPQLHETLERLSKSKDTLAYLMGAMHSGRELDKGAGVVLGMRQMRNNADDYIAVGSILRRMCDLIEPVYDT